MTDNPTNLAGGADPLNFPRAMNLESLDPARCAAAFDDIVRAITAGAIAERARLVADSTFTVRTTLLGAIASWSAPAFAAAAAVLIAAGATLTLLPTPVVAAPVSFAESAGISRSLVEWSTDNHSPTPAELLGAVEDGSSRRAR